MTTGEIITTIASGLVTIIAAISVAWTKIMNERNKLAIVKEVSEEVKAVVPAAVQQAMPAAMDAVLRAQEEAKNNRPLIGG